MITRGMLNYMLSVVPELSKYDVRKQVWYTSTCFGIGSGVARKHNLVPSSFVLESRYLREAFGKGFHVLNNSYGLFQFDRCWRQGSARPCNATPQLRQLIEEFYCSEFVSDRQRIDANGRKIKSRTRAIFCKDVSGQTARVRSGLNAFVPVDVGAISALITGLEGRFALSSKDSRLLMSARLLRNFTEFDGCVYQTYTESPSGRLYANNSNLQNCPSMLRKAALNGQYDHDIINCHFSIFLSLAKKHGNDAPQIEYYVAQREDLLERLSEDTGEERSNLKTALLALVYGAGLQRGGALESLLIEGYEEFVNDLEVISLQNEIRRVGRIIVDQDGELTQRGHLKNILGKSIPMPYSFGQRLSHILQGYEALAMQKVLDRYEGEISVLQHDGYTLQREVGLEDVQNEMRTEHGVEIEYKVEQLRAA